MADMHNSSLLDVAPRADTDIIRIPTQHGSGPDGNALSQFHVANYDGGGVHIDLTLDHKERCA